MTPEILYYTPKFLYERCHLPLIVTENGIANPDWVSLDGKVHDPQRVDYMARYLQCLGRVQADGVDVRGYFAWFFLDNMEWNNGYNERFGLVYADYATQRRTLKDSARFYQDVIMSDGDVLQRM